jgi:hypothetical protein
MKIPNKVKIGGLTYTVEETPHIAFGENYNGEILYRELKIKIRPMAAEVMARSFCHEVVHAIYDNLGYSELDEKRIDELAGALHALIVDNPEMFKEDGQNE